MLAVRTTSKLPVVAMAVTFIAGLLLLGNTAFAADPPGNNGTVKIDNQPFDSHPSNEPHVGCTFQVDFYGYDEGDLNATVIFTLQSPTKRDSGSQTPLTDTVFIGEDSKAGGGSLAGRDASKTYTLDVTGVKPHAQQGFHVKLTIHAKGTKGADVKHKVFWVQGCQQAPTTTTVATPPPGGVLPFTGSSSVPLTIAGLTLLTLGAASLAVSRRHRRSGA